MGEWNIPHDAEELFFNGEQQYSIRDLDYSGDNIYAMNLFMDFVNVPDEMVEYQIGTQVVVCDGKIRLVIDSGGLGDFHLHVYNVTLHETQPS